MRERFEITVKRWFTDDEDIDTYEELFTLAGPREVAARGVGMAAEVLGAGSASVTMDNRQATFTPLPTEAVNAFRQDDDGRAEREQQAEADKPKRTRRTKAQMEADKAAELAAATQTTGDALQQHANSPGQGGTPQGAEEWRTGPVGGEEPGTVSTPPAAAAWPAPGSMPARALSGAAAYSPFGPPQS